MCSKQEEAADQLYCGKTSCFRLDQVYEKLLTLHSWRDSSSLKKALSEFLATIHAHQEYLNESPYFDIEINPIIYCTKCQRLKNFSLGYAYTPIAVQSSREELSTILNELNSVRQKVYREWRKHGSLESSCFALVGSNPFSYLCS